jgi:hypothetical protein
MKRAFNTEATPTNEIGGYGKLKALTASTKKLCIPWKLERRALVSTKGCSTNYFTRRVITERYQEIIEQFIVLLNDEQYCWLQQYGRKLLLHRCRRCANFLKNMSPLVESGLHNLGISHFQTFFAVLFKRIVYMNNTHRLGEQKQYIQYCILHSTTETRNKGDSSISNRVVTSTAERGRHFKHIS